MWKSFVSTMKGLGKKAIGFIRGLNGDKAAAFASSTLGSWINPAAGAAVSPFLSELGRKFNEKLDEWSKDEVKKGEGGVQKPILSSWGRRNREFFKNLKPNYEKDKGKNTYAESFS